MHGLSMTRVKVVIFFGTCTFGRIVRYRDTSPMIGYAYHQIKYMYCDTI